MEASAVQVTINAINQRSQGLKVRDTELEKIREWALRIPAVTDAGVADISMKLQTLLETTEPRELKVILMRIFEMVEIAGNTMTFLYTFGESVIANYASLWRPRGDLNP